MTPTLDLLHDVARGDSAAWNELIDRLYNELLALAAAKLAHAPPGFTLETSDLVQEAFLRLFGSKDPHFENRGHLFGAAAKAMHDVLVDYARRKKRLKRGGGNHREPLDAVPPRALVTFGTGKVEAMDLHEALTRLAEKSPRQARILELRFLTGLSLEEIAQTLDVSLATVKRDCKLGLARLQQALDRDGSAAPGARPTP